ncbi:RecX family transcriptional regulator [Candidatus Saccharibacteria bacterium]|nr:RecX family transcriptional regulator [Candidatus Saccharibacteria bacterium]
MEIYKLSDEIPDEGLTKHKKYGRMESEALEGAGVSGGAVLKITDIKQGVKNPNRVNVCVNGKYAFSLDVVQVVDLKIKVGREISAEELARFKEASEYGKAYQRALEWVLVRPRSVGELRDYLKRRKRVKEAKELKDDWQREREAAEMVARGEDVKMKKQRSRKKYDFDDLIVQRLCEKGYVDDEKFAEYYVENRFVKKGISKKRLKMELVKKGVDAEIIERVLDGRDDETEILKMIAKKRAKYDDEKLVAYLCRQGFSYQLVKELVEKTIN